MKSIFVDANIIIRLIIKDDLQQSEQSEIFFKKVEYSEIRAVFSILVISEVLWIIERLYKVKKSVLIPQVLTIVNMRHVEIFEVSKEILVQTLELMKNKNVDFTDAYLFVNRGNREIFSFDTDFKKLAR